MAGDMPAEIAKLTEEAEVAQADYETLLSVCETSTGLEKMRVLSRLTASQMRRDETFYALVAALRAPRNNGILAEQTSRRAWFHPGRALSTDARRRIETHWLHSEADSAKSGRIAFALFHCCKDPLSDNLPGTMRVAPSFELITCQVQRLIHYLSVAAVKWAFEL